MSYDYFNYNSNSVSTTPKGEPIYIEIEFQYHMTRENYLIKF